MNLLGKITRKKMPRIIFIHVPKCGGSSVDMAIQKKYAKYGIPQMNLDAIASKKSADHKGAEMVLFRENILLYNMAKPIYACNYISGHFAWSEAVATYLGDWKPVTVLRDPVKKFYSQYFFNRYKKEDHFKINMPLKEYVDTQSAANLGKTYLNTFSFKGNPSVAGAIKNMESFASIGILEHLESFQDDLKVMGLNISSIGHINKNPRKKTEQNSEITNQIHKKVLELCKPDIEIYNHFKTK